MKKITVCLCIILIVMTFSGCSINASYKFLQNSSEIQTIEIVEVEGYDSQKNAINTTTLIAINNPDIFIDDFKNIECFLHYTDPTGVKEGEIVIKVLYNDDEYELIGASGQSTYTNERQYKHYAGYRYFDSEQFEKFVLKYLEMDLGKG